jgi:hypothetical protein
MSIQSCHVAPLSERSHLAVMVPLSGLTVSVDRTAPLASQLTKGLATSHYDASVRRPEFQLVFPRI